MYFLDQLQLNHKTWIYVQHTIINPATEHTRDFCETKIISLSNVIGVLYRKIIGWYSDISAMLKKNLRRI